MAQTPRDLAKVAIERILYGGSHTMRATPERGSVKIRLSPSEYVWIGPTRYVFVVRVAGQRDVWQGAVTEKLAHSLSAWFVSVWLGA